MSGAGTAEAPVSPRLRRLFALASLYAAASAPAIRFGLRLARAIGPRGLA